MTRGTHPTVTFGASVEASPRIPLLDRTATALTNHQLPININNCVLFDRQHCETHVPSYMEYENTYHRLRPRGRHHKPTSQQDPKGPLRRRTQPRQVRAVALDVEHGEIHHDAIPIVGPESVLAQVLAPHGDVAELEGPEGGEEGEVQGLLEVLFDAEDDGVRDGGEVVGRKAGEGVGRAGEVEGGGGQEVGRCFVAQGAARGEEGVWEEAGADGVGAVGGGGEGGFEGEGGVVEEVGVDGDADFGGEGEEAQGWW